MRLLVALGGLALASCATAQAQDAAEARGHDWDRVSMEAKSWGRMVSGWSIGKSGTGGWWVRENSDGSLTPYGAYSVTYHSFDAGPEGFARVREALADIPNPAPEASDGCENFMTDAVYGTVRVTQQATTIETAWNEGCMDDDYVAFMSKLRAANELVESWGKAGTVQRTESFDETGAATGITYPENAQ